MKKLVFVIFILQSICSYGQPQRLQANRSDFGKTNKNSKNVILDTGTYFFTNGRTSKRVSRLSSAANSVKKQIGLFLFLKNHLISQYHRKEIIFF